MSGEPRVMIWNGVKQCLEAWKKDAFFVVWDSLNDHDKVILVKAQWGEAAVGMPISKLIRRMPIEPMRRYTDNIRELFTRGG